MRITNSPAELLAQIARAGQSPKVVLEATYGWYWAADTLAAAGAEVHLAHPLTADVPPGPAAAGPARPPAPARRRPLARAAAQSGICLLITANAVGILAYLDPDGPGPQPQFWAGLMLVLAIAGFWTAVGIMANAVLTSWDQESFRRQLPPRLGPGGHAPDGEQCSGTGHGPVPPGPRTDQTRADLRARKSRQHRQHIHTRGRPPVLGRPGITPASWGHQA